MKMISSLPAFLFISAIAFSQSAPNCASYGTGKCKVTNPAPQSFKRPGIPTNGRITDGNELYSPDTANASGKVIPKLKIGGPHIDRIWGDDGQYTPEDSLLYEHCTTRIYRPGLVFIADTSLYIRSTRCCWNSQFASFPIYTSELVQIDYTGPTAKDSIKCYLHVGGVFMDRLMMSGRINDGDELYTPEENGHNKNYKPVYPISVYPNPSSGSATITYSLEKPGKAQLTLVNILGEEMTLSTAQEQAAGKHEFFFDAKRFSLAAGMYFVKLNVDGQDHFVRLILE